jgi:hypothetical protein
MGKLKGLLAKTVSAVALIGVAAVGVAAVLTVGSMISRKKESGVSSSESGVSDDDETNAGAEIRSRFPINQRGGPAS